MDRCVGMHWLRGDALALHWLVASACISPTPAPAPTHFKPVSPHPQVLDGPHEDLRRDALDTMCALAVALGQVSGPCHRCT